MQKRGTTAILAACMAALLLLSVFLLVPSLSRVTAAGDDVRSYPSDTVYEVELIDRVTVYIDEETWDRVPSELAIQVALFCLAGIALLAAIVLRGVAAPSRYWQFYLVTAAGLAWLGLDEAWGLHETIGHNLPFLAGLPGIGKPDDLVFASYLIPAAVVAWIFRGVLMSVRLAWGLLLAGLAVFALAGIMDIRGLPLDEPLEVLLALLLVLSFAVLLRAHLDRWVFRPPRNDWPDPVSAGPETSPTAEKPSTRATAAP